MFTPPEARGQGIAQALIERVIKYGFDEAARIGKTFAASILVYEDNPAARGLYAKCGFVPFKEEPLDGESPRVVIFLKYAPESRGAQGSA
jgi:GNAT superfamily N-acetyltransferase